MRRSNNIPFMIGMAYVALALISLTMSLSQRLINALSLGAVLLSVSELLNVCNMQKAKKKSITDILKREDGKDKYGFAIFYMQEILKEKNSEIKRRKSVLAFFSILCSSFAFMCLIVYPYTDVLTVFDRSNRFSVFCTVISLGIVFISISIENGKELDSEIKDSQEIIDCFLQVTNEANKQVEKAINMAETAVEIKKDSATGTKKTEKNKHNRKKSSTDV